MLEGRRLLGVSQLGKTGIHLMTVAYSYTCHMSVSARLAFPHGVGRRAIHYPRHVVSCEGHSCVSRVVSVEQTWLRQVGCIPCVTAALVVPVN